MSPGRYLLGLLLLGITAGACWGAARIVVSRRLPALPAHARGAAYGVLFGAALLVAALVPAALGLLGRASGPICAVALLAATRALVRPRKVDADRGLAPAEPLLARAFAGAALALVAGWALAAAWLGSAIPSQGRDTLTFHLPEAVRWMQTGTIWRVDQFEPLLANAYYPQNGDALNLVLLEPFQSDAFVRVLGVLSLPVLALAVYALARELGARPAAATVGAALLASLPISVLTAEEGAKTDLWCVAALAVAGLFLHRHLRTGASADLLLGGLALGIGFGTKWYGVTAALLVAAAWAVARLWQQPRVRAAAGEAGTLVGLCALGGGVWLVRNWVESGNPLFPAPVGLAGVTLFDAPADPIRECTGFSVADYLGDTAVLEHVLWPLWRQALGAGAAILLAALVAAPFIGRPRRPMVALAALGAALVAMYVVLPYGALGVEGEPVFAGPNTRYLLPALTVAAVMFACVLPRLGRLRHVAELVAVVAVANGLRHGLLIGDGRLAAGVAAAAVLGVLLIAGRRLPRPVATAGIAFAVLALAVVAYARQRDFYDDRYRGADPALDFLSAAPHGTRVGLAGFESTGTVPHVLPAFGKTLGSSVTYVGEDYRGQLRAYEDRRRFQLALVRGSFEYLLVARGRYAVRCMLPGENADPGGWARAAGWRPLTQTPALALYRRP